MRILVLLLTLLLALVLYAANVHFGNLNQDEGWYLYAAQSVARGDFPYRDFAYTQAPLLPYVYSLANPVIDAMGVKGGRIFTASLGFLAILFACFAAARLTKRTRSQAMTAFVLAFALIGLNTFQSYYFSIVKTYSLCALFFAAGFLALTFVRRERAWPAFLAGLFLALAAGVRVSAGLALPIMGLTLLMARRLTSDRPWFIYGIGGIIGLTLAFLPSFLMAREGMIFGLVEYHAGRTAENPLVLKAGFISRLVQDYYLAFALLALLLAAWVFRITPLEKVEKLDAESSRSTAFQAVQGTGLPGGSLHSPLITGTWITLAGITALHLATAFPYDDYQVFLYPIFGALIAAHLSRWLVTSNRVRNFAVVGMFLLATASSFSSPINQDWFIRGRDRIWWKSKTNTDLDTLELAASYARELADGNPAAELLTQDTYLAVQAGMRVPHGLQMGCFSYYPEMADDRAERLHLLNRASLTNLLATTEAPIAALSGYGLAIQCPEVSELPTDEQKALRSKLLERFKSLPHATVPHFGQGHTTLEFFTQE